MLKQRQDVGAEVTWWSLSNCHTASNEVDVNKPLCVVGVKSFSFHLTDS